MHSSADVRWVAVHPDSGAGEAAAGIFVAPMPGDPLLQMSVSRYGASQLAACAHDKELRPEDCVHLHLVRKSSLYDCAWRLSVKLRRVAGGVALTCSAYRRRRQDHRHMGLGGDDSWTRSVHERFLVHPGRFDFGLRLHAVPAGADADQLYRRAFGRAAAGEGGSSAAAGGGGGGGEKARSGSGSSRPQSRHEQRATPTTSGGGRGVHLSGVIGA